MDRLRQADPAYIGLVFVAVALAVYVFSHPSRTGWYDHFVWQADAFLSGRFAIEYPVESGRFVNAYLQDVMPLPRAADGTPLGIVPFPPLPAIVLLPFVGIFGLATDAQLVGAVIGAINVGLAWRLARRLTDNGGAAVLATTFFAFGTVHWYAAMLSTTWFLAHVVAITFLLLGITLALDAERRQQLRRLGRPRAAPDDPHPISALVEDRSLFLGWYRALSRHVDGVQFAAGFVFGLGALARLPVIFGAPFFLFVGGGGSYWRRGLSAGLGAVIPIALLLVYNLAATGHVFNPAYEWLYQTEYLGYLPPVPPQHCPFTLEFCAGLTINREYAIEDLRHVPLNALIMFAWPPIIRPECGLELFDRTCTLVRPDQIGMSIFLTSPAYLLAVPIIARAWRQRLVMGAFLAILAIALLNLMHFSQGWVQFGYRFSNDFAPFAMVLVTLAVARFSARPLALGVTVALVALSVLINAWGVYWGVTLGW